jgi:hypothetical protein
LIECLNDRRAEKVVEGVGEVVVEEDQEDQEDQEARQ